MARLNNKFNFFVPFDVILKANAPDVNLDVLPENLEIEGIASDEVEDVDEETLECIGFDYKPFLEKGFLNWNHQANKTASAIIGEPTEARIVANGKKFYIRGFLYKGSPEAMAVYRLGRILEMSGSKRRLGFSIEGQATERDILNPKRIKKARITGCAITASPKNPNTLMSIIKGDYDQPFVEDEEIEEETEKAMTAGNTNILSVESIDGVKSTNARKNSDVVQTLKKSEIYNRIFKDYSTDVEVAKSIYNYILLANEKITNMEGGKVTPEALEKALSFLDQTIVKSEEQVQVTDKPEAQAENQVAAQTTTVVENVIAKSDDGESDEEKFDKACKMAKSFFDQGFNKGQVLDEMSKAGYAPEMAEGACQRCINDANANKEGGKVVEQSPVGFDKAEMTSAFAELFAGQNELIKGMNDNMDRKFGAVGTLIKGVLGENEELKKSIDALTTRLSTVEGQSQGRKSITNVKALERFQKSEDGGVSEANSYNIVKADERRALINRLGVEVDRLRGIGRSNLILEKGVATLEIAKSFGTEREVAEIMPILQGMGLNVYAQQ